MSDAWSDRKCQLVFDRINAGIDERVPSDQWVILLVRGIAAEARSNVAGPGPAEQRAQPDEKGNS